MRLKRGDVLSQHMCVAQVLGGQFFSPARFRGNLEHKKRADDVCHRPFRMLCRADSVSLRRVDLFEERLQFGPATVDAAFHRSHRKSSDVGNLFVCQLLDITQNDYFAELLRNLTKSFLDEEVLDRGLGVLVICWGFWLVVTG